MTDQTDKPKLGTRPPLGLKRTVETGKVKQSFSHGRSNTVVVEVKKRRILAKPGEAPAADAPEVAAAVEAPAPAPAPVVEAAPAATPAPAAARPAAPAPQRRVPVDDILSRRELQEKLLREADEARMTSLEEARRREDRAKIDQSVDEKRRAEENRKAEEEAAVRAAADAADAARAAADAEVAPAGDAGATAGRDEERRFTRPAAPGHAPKRPEPARPSRGRDDHRKSGKLTVTRALTGEDDSRTRSLAALRRAREKEKRAHASAGPSAKQVRDVVVPEAITIQELAIRMAERGADLVKALFKMGTAVTLTETIDQDTAELLVTEFGHNIKRVSDSDVDIDSSVDVDADETLVTRAPGRHDHGPCRSRQDVAARRDPRRQRPVGRSRRHHPAYRRLPGVAARRVEDHLPRHPGPRSVHRDAPARRQRDRHRHPGGRCRRRAEAADGRGDQAHPRRQRPDDRCDQQDRQARRQPAENPRGIASV